MQSTKITAVQHTEEVVAITRETLPAQTATPPDTQGEDLPRAATPHPAAATVNPAPKPVTKPAPKANQPQTTEAAAEKKEEPARHHIGHRGAFFCPATAAAFPPSPPPKLPQFAPSPPSPVETGIRRKQSAAAVATKTAPGRATMPRPASRATSATRQFRNSTGSTTNKPPSHITASAKSPRRTGAEWGLRQGAKSQDDGSADDTPALPKRTSTKRASVDDDEADDTPRPKRRRMSASPSPFYEPAKHERELAQSKGRKRSSLANSGWSSSEAEPDNQLKIYIRSPAEANDKELSVGAPSPSPRPNENCRPNGLFPTSGVMPLGEQEIIQRRGSQQWEDPCRKHILEGDIMKLGEAYQQETERIAGIIDAYEKAKVEAEDKLLACRGDVIDLDKDLAVWRERLKEAKYGVKTLEEVVKKSRQRYEGDDDEDRLG